MSEEKERSVIERLDDIEKKLPNSKQLSLQVRTSYIDDEIGCPFSEYMEKSTIYSYEDDKRRFDYAIRKGRTIPIVWLCIFLVALGLHIFGFISIRGNEWLLIISDIFAMLPFIFVLLILSKQKNKQPVKSFWNIHNREFYLVDKGDHANISIEKKNGFCFYVLLFFKVFANLGCLALTLVYFIVGLQTYSSNGLYWLCSFSSYVVSLLVVVIVKYNVLYSYSMYLFETDDSFVVYPGLKYHKKNK